MRVHVCAVRMTLHRADVLEAYLNGQDNIQKATVYERTGDVVLTYRGSRKDAAALLAALAGASAYGAWRVHQQLNRIHNALPDYPILKPVTRSKTYSLLQSEERVSYQLGCDNLFSSEMFGGQRPSLTLRHVVSHNPLKPGVHTEIVWSPQWQEKLKTLYGEQPPLAIDTRLRWNGDVETTLHSPGVKVDRDSRHVNWQGLTLVLQYDQSVQKVSFFRILI